MILSQDFKGEVVVQFHGDGLERRAVSVVAEVMPLPALLTVPCPVQADPGAGIQGSPGNKQEAG